VEAHLFVELKDVLADRTERRKVVAELLRYDNDQAEINFL
jgi:hypothetical protein